MLAVILALLQTAAAAEPVRDAAVAMTAPVAPATLAAGTDLPLRLMETLDSQTNVKGDVFAMEIAQDIEVGGAVILPQGTPVFGEISFAARKGAFGQSGKLEARLLYAEVNGRPVRLNGQLRQYGAGAPTATAIGIAAIGTLAFVITGKRARMEQGSELTVRLDRPVQLPQGAR